MAIGRRSALRSRLGSWMMALFSAAIISQFYAARLRADDDCCCGIFSCLRGTLFADDCKQKSADDGGSDDEKKTSYGPCCQPRKTLLQWSYGTTFSGGPPGMDEPLEADRPGFTISVVTVGKGVVQLESGYTFTLDNAGGVHHIEHDFPDTLWRIGMFADWFEWRIEYNYSIINNTISTVAPPIHQGFSGSDDLLLGIKLCLTPQEGILPAMALVPQMSVPSGSPSLTAGQVLPGVLWGYQWDLSKKFSLVGLTAVVRATDDAGTEFTDFEQALSLNINLSKQLQGYVEWYVIAPNGVTLERTQHNADGGFAYHLTNNIQLDIECGVGLNAAADDFFAGSGLVVRF